MTKIIITLQKDKEYAKPHKHTGEAASKPKLNVKGQRVQQNIEKSRLLNKENCPDKLPALSRAAIIIPLDDCIQQLHIIKGLVNEPINTSWSDLFKYETLDERFSLATPKKKIKFIEEEYEKIPFSEKQKLQKDVCFLITTLRETALEISDKGSYDTIINVLQDVKKQNEESDLVEEHFKTSQKELKLLRSVYRREKRDYKNAIEQAQTHLRQLEIEIEDVLTYGRRELSYTDNWERARRYQHDLKLSTEEGTYSKTITKYSAKTEYENRIHNELQNFIEENIEDLQNAINYWMNQYDEEIERRDADIMKQKMIWETLIEDHNALAETFEEHRNFVLERRAVNEERRRLAEIFRIETAAAIKIQAWWRGTMVRKKLGRFKEKKKRGKDGKDAKGAKGKKMKK